MPDTGLGDLHPSSLIFNRDYSERSALWSDYEIFARWRHLSKILCSEAEPRFNQGDQKSALLLWKSTNSVHRLIDSNSVGGPLWHSLMTSVTWKWNKLLWERLSSPDRERWSRGWSSLDGVKELQVGNGPGRLRPSRAMDTWIHILEAWFSNAKPPHVCDSWLPAFPTRCSWWTSPILQKKAMHASYPSQI